MLFDFHTHSAESDGTYSVEELALHAEQNSISMLALCDHDTTSGIERFRHSLSGTAISAVAGIEIAANWVQGNCHVLGYGFDGTSTELQELLVKMRNDRFARNDAICRAFNLIGIGLTPDDIGKHARGESVGRPHVARALVDKGVVGSVNEAFDKYLGKGKPAYIERFRLEPHELVALLKRSGAAVVLAHPMELKRDIQEISALVMKLKEFGLDGIEVYSPSNAGFYHELSDLARRGDFIISGGSDFHGLNKPNNKIGQFSPGEKLSDDLLGTRSVEFFKSLTF